MNEAGCRHFGIFNTRPYGRFDGKPGASCRSFTHPASSRQRAC